MKNEGFKEITAFDEGESLVMYYEDQYAEPVLIREKDIPMAICNNMYGDAIFTTMFDQFICSTFGCFINNIDPGYSWVRNEVAEFQMSGKDVEIVEFVKLD